MKQFLILCAFFQLVLSGCTRYEKQEAANQKVDLAESRRDSLENELVRTMDEINRNLEMIKEKQGLISVGSGAENIRKKTSVLENISLINSLLEDNRKKIMLLSQQSEQLGKEKSALTKIARQTKDRIEKQENEISALKIQLALEEFKVADLNVKMDELQVTNEKLAAEKADLSMANEQFDKELNKAWFVYGTYDELRTKKILEKRSALPSGKKNQLSDDFYKNRSFFSELDVRTIFEIPIQGKKPKLITFHPADSYSITESGQYSKITVTDPPGFWSTSRFLVVEVK